MHAVDKQGLRQGHEVDVFVITKNNKIVIVEITTTEDLNTILEIAKEKEKRLADIHYDALVFVTPSTVLEDYSRYGKHIRIYGAKHIPKIAENIEFLLDEIS